MWAVQEPGGRVRYGVETALRIKVLKDAQFHLSAVSHLLFDASIPQACVDCVISTSGGILGKMSRRCYSSNQALDTPCIGFLPFTFPTLLPVLMLQTNVLMSLNPKPVSNFLPLGYLRLRQVV